MSIFRNDTLGSWTRGGQAIVHNVRMTTQVFIQTVAAGIVLWVGGTLWYVLEKANDYQRYVAFKIVEATLKSDVPGGAPLLFRGPEGPEYWTNSDTLLESGVAKQALRAMEHHLLVGAALVGCFSLLMLFWAWFYFTRTGRGLGSNQFLRGARFGTPRQLRRLLWRSRKGSFAIGGVQVPDAFEPEHILICGAPGTGKTNIIVKMLAGIRKQGRRAIVYDAAGTFVEKFYKPGHDILLNPLDARADSWSPWVDVPRDYHYDQIAESTIPDKSGDPFWAKAARGTLVAVFRKLARDNRMLVSVLLDTILRSPLKDLATFAEGTDAAAFISTEGDRTSAGIRAELASVMRSFSYLDDTLDGFSIRDWVANEEDDSWLFITVKADQLPSLRPLITVWLDIAISAIMSLTPDRARRLYCVIDELPTLQKLPSLSDFLARARKYGGCGILGFQSYPQLEATYGIQDAAAITGYCSTWVALRANDTPTAKHVSENLGQVEQVEANEGMSYGVNDMRDGVNLSRMQVTRPLVMHTEVTNLPNLTGFLRFGRDLPVARFKDSYNRSLTCFPAFEERTAPAVRLSPVLAAQERDVPKDPKRKLRPSSKAVASPELPLDAEIPLRADVPPASEPGAAPQEHLPSTSGPELLGRSSGFGLTQHGRRGGMRSASRPA
ncbi:type IV secretion system DNA-binding domain-containing protein [Sphingobium sp. AR-3-1]|uniref:Type IV secretion system DNA-binding domain-containing protein n=1 Tax=Sphingobium psychrophilum TaxID=2728834 RepID=A0A7X9WZ25_9SPHN|nr:type IV secretion system DNA-binding domain-containing protein [Sphingobium psychrophilum]NML12163.1 type IV secretion system DNA-binding domain-containing protein [Sphingobium psychrophilum]